MCTVVNEGLRKRRNVRESELLVRIVHVLDLSTVYGENEKTDLKFQGEGREWGWGHREISEKYPGGSVMTTVQLYSKSGICILSTCIHIL